MPVTGPRLAVLSTLFPCAGQPISGIFIRERMFRVGDKLPIFVMAPKPWFPLQSLIRLWRPFFRPDAPLYERQNSVDVYHPRFVSVPGVLKSLDGRFMAIACRSALHQLKEQHGFDIVDAHFAYPEGYAAALLGKWLNVPFTITVRGSEYRLAKSTAHRFLITRALDAAAHVFTVSETLKELVLSLGTEESKVTVVANGVDTRRYHPVDKTPVRKELDIPAEAPVLISVGGIVERKGFHRVIACLPKLRERFPELVYLIVGGPGPEGDARRNLEDQVSKMGLGGSVRFLGVVPPERLKFPLSASDVFVLATRNEGWANVFLEAMACGLPVVTTDVGGNREVVSRRDLGTVVPFGDSESLQRALHDALAKTWDREGIIRYAADNSWDSRASVLVEKYRQVYYDYAKGAK